MDNGSKDNSKTKITAISVGITAVNMYLYAIQNRIFYLLDKNWLILGSEVKLNCLFLY